ncbi:MAG: hypothetical protein CVU44_14535 [Chloroflexi bacterium HGW-Chloroflexi-6]|nr:MAG: hypothetical protein CVU44_14535 [Chloroflexi bacterium HGW-Chloroflexi-6]
MNKELYNCITVEYLLHYFSSEISLFRRCQNKFIADTSVELRGRLIEIGAEKKWNYKALFKNSENYIMSNVQGDYDIYLDATNMKQIEDASVDGLICVSVLEHIFDFRKAVQEMSRVLKVGGKAVITVPFIFPYHDQIDYWRFSDSALVELFRGFKIIRLVHFGGILSTLSNFLQRPPRRISKRYIFYKTIGLILGILGLAIERMDTFPLGYGILIEKEIVHLDANIANHV